MFLGNYQHNLDEKGRLMIPARFRELLLGGAFITQGFDRCLMIMTNSSFDEIYRRLNAMNMADPTTRLLKRQILGNAYAVEIDKVGRVLIPAGLRQFCQLDGEAVLVGQGEYFEIWSPSNWTDQLTQLQDVDANNQRYSTLDLSARD